MSTVVVGLAPAPAAMELLGGWSGRPARRLRAILCATNPEVAPARA